MKKNVSVINPTFNLSSTRNDKTKNYVGLVRIMIKRNVQKLGKKIWGRFEKKK